MERDDRSSQVPSTGREAVISYPQRYPARRKELKAYISFSNKFTDRKKQPEPYKFLEKCYSLWGTLTPRSVSRRITKNYHKGVEKQVVSFFGLPGSRKTSSATALHNYLTAHGVSSTDITSVTIDAAFKTIDTGDRGPGTYTPEDFNNATNKFEEMIDTAMLDPIPKIVSIETPIVTGAQAADYLARKKREMLRKQEKSETSGAEETVNEGFRGYNRGLTAIDHMFGVNDEISDDPERRQGGKYRMQIINPDGNSNIPFYVVGLVAGNLDNLLAWREHPQLDAEGNIMPGSTALGTKVANEEVRALLEENEFILQEAKIPRLHLRLYMIDRFRLQVNAATIQWYLERYLQFPKKTGFIAVSHLPLKEATVVQ